MLATNTTGFGTSRTASSSITIYWTLSFCMEQCNRCWEERHGNKKAGIFPGVLLLGRDYSCTTFGCQQKQEQRPLQHPEKFFYLLFHCYLMIVTNIQVNNQVKYCFVGSYVCRSSLDPLALSTSPYVRYLCKTTWSSLNTNKKNIRLVGWIERVYLG